MHRLARFSVLAVLAIAAASCSKKKEPAPVAPAAGTDHAAAPAAAEPTSPATPKAPVAPAGDGKVTLQLPIIREYYPPFYPFSLRLKGTEGRTQLSLDLDEKGDVVDAKVASSTAPRFNDYAVAAARTWRFSPALADGKPVALKDVPYPAIFASEFASAGMPAGSPLAGLAQIDGLVYRMGADGKYALVESEQPIPIDQAPPFVDPVKLKDQKVQVKVAFSVSDEGEVIDPTIIEPSHTVFDEAVLRAVRSWTFIPKLVGGKPVRSAVRIPVVYSPPPAKK